MKAEIVEHLAKNRLRLKAEVAGLGREKIESLKKNPEFEDVVKDQYLQKLKSWIIKDLSLNLGVDYETSMIELEEIDLVKALNLDVK